MTKLDKIKFNSIVCWLALLIITNAFICIKANDCNFVCEPNHWMLIFDAGSTKTRLWIFKFSTATSNEASGSVINLIEAKKLGKLDSLSNFQNRKTLPSLRAKITKILQDVKNNPSSGFDKKCLKCTYASLLATAGLRVVERGISNSILSAVYEGIRNSRFLITHTRVKILSGEGEATRDWMAVNYLMSNRLEGYGTSAAKYIPAMDLGGGSTQVALVVKPGVNYPFSQNDAVEKIDLFGKSVKLYRKSYLGFGMWAYKQRMLMRSSVSKCLHESYTGSFVFGGKNNVVQGDPTGNSKSRYTDCVQEILPLLASVNKVRGLNAPTMRVFGISAFYYAISNSNKKRCEDDGSVAKTPFCLDLLGNEKNKQLNITISDLEGTARYFCANVPIAEPPLYAYFFCSDLVYIHQLLTTGYGFLPTDTLEIGEFSSDGFEISWTLGHAIMDFAKQTGRIMPPNEA